LTIFIESALLKGEKMDAKKLEQLTLQMLDEKKKWKELKKNINEEEKHKRHSIPQDTKDKVWNRDGGKCIECGRKEKL
ncbi:uncharacterized protein METZ01_LOCUS508209, partial [marine metagenome]